VTDGESTERPDSRDATDAADRQASRDGRQDGETEQHAACPLLEAVDSDGDDGGDASDAATSQAALDALADPDCRRIVAALAQPRTAKAVAEACDLPQTTTYRKLGRLSDGGLVEERVAVSTDGHHATTYVRDFAGVIVAFDDDGQTPSSPAAGASPDSTDGADGGTTAADEADADPDPEPGGPDTPTGTFAVEIVRDDSPTPGAGEAGPAEEDPAPARDSEARDDESPDERLARYWREVSDEL
jgi:hypothetical protein